jgi:hypothetical protein
MRAVQFFVCVRSMARRNSSNCDHVAEYCSVGRIPVFTETTNSGRRAGNRLRITSQPGCIPPPAQVADATSRFTSIAKQPRRVAGCLFIPHALPTTERYELLVAVVGCGWSLESDFQPISNFLWAHFRCWPFTKTHPNDLSFGHVVAPVLMVLCGFQRKVYHAT